MAVLLDRLDHFEALGMTHSSLCDALRESRRSLDKIGEGDWTPQDMAHERLAQAVEKHLSTPYPRFETVRYAWRTLRGTNV
jgi:ribosome-binding protein aMBF1 (putative translation factor)